MVDAGFAGALSRKYDIQQEQADTARRLGYAQSDLVGAQAAAYPQEAAARAYAERGAGYNAFAGGNLQNVNTSLAPSIASAENFARYADAFARQYATQSFGSLGSAADQRFGRGGSLDGSPAAPSPGFSTGGDLGNITTFSNPVGGTATKIAPLTGYNTGTSMVPGKGSPKVDSVKAKLAPGEAVLNAAAAEHLGRSTIDFLNAIGAHKMGLMSQPDTRDVSTPAKGSKDDSGQAVNNQTGGTPGYKAGTSKVPAKGKGKADPSPTLPPPQVMQALMAMQSGQSGGGMPQSPSMSPMPMAMPPLGGR